MTHARLSATVCVQLCIESRVVEQHQHVVDVCETIVVIHLALRFEQIYISYGVLAFTTFSDGCLGSNNDEGRSEV